jgi:ATP-binding cassette subfamily B protein RaxB
MARLLADFSGRRRLPVIHQTEATECGLACLAMVAAYHGHHVDLGHLRRRHPVSLQGATLKSLMQVAAHLDLACRPLRFELHQIHELRLPAILHWDLNHYMVLKAVTAGGGLVVHDPALGERRYTSAEASKHLTGVALEAVPTAALARKDERVRLPLATFWGQVRGGGHALAQVFALSLVLEILVIASPFYMQLALDEVVAKGDLDLLLVLALGFGLLKAIAVASTALRSFVLILQNTLSLQMGANLFRHLVRLPLAFFEKRHVGDVMSRFASTEPIRRLLAEGLVAAVIDGIMALATFAMIVLYSGTLAAVVLAALLVYALLRLALYGEFRRRSEAQIQAKAQESST